MRSIRVPAPINALAVRFLLRILRPVLLVHLWIYTRNMRSAVFPGDELDHSLPGSDPERVLFVGDVAVAGYGVYFEGMALPAQIALNLHQQHACGVVWNNIGSFDLTARKAAAAVRGHVAGIDVAVVALGIPDVLLVTDQEAWRASLNDVIAEIHAGAGMQCRIILAGLPPMDRFQAMPPVARNAIRIQMHQLDAVMAEAAAADDTITFVPFPELDLAGMYMRNVFSFRAMHRIWAEALAPHLTPNRLTRHVAI